MKLFIIYNITIFLFLILLLLPQHPEDSTGKLMMLPSDIALLQDPEFRKIVELYAKNEDAFFQDFAKAFAKLLELGCTFSAKPWYKFW